MAGRNQKSAAPEPTASSESEAAHILGLRDRSSIAGYIRRGCPGGDGVYPLVQMRDWIAANIRQDARSVTGEKTDEHSELADRLELANVLKTEAEAASKQAQLAVYLGTLVERSVVESEIRSLFNGIRHRLQAIPEEIGGSIPPDFRLDVTLDMTSKMELLLQELAECSHGPPQPPPPEPSARPEADSPSPPTRGKSRGKRAGSAPAAKPSARSKSRRSSPGRGAK